MNIKAANQAALERLTQGEPVLVDCVPARDALGLAGRIVLHAGPPLPWERRCSGSRVSWRSCGSSVACRACTLRSDPRAD